MARSRSSKTRDLLKGLAFLGPNILGFLAFTLFPLAFSLAMAFTNWDLKLQNMFKKATPQFNGVSNFIELFTEPHFWQFLGNTFFMMMVLPFSIGGALFAAVLLSKDNRGGSRRIWAWLIASAVLFLGCIMLVLAGAGETALTLLLVGLFGGTLLFGALGGNGFYRTLFYLPNFTAGVATYLLWKKIYAVHSGPINNVLAPMLTGLAHGVNATPSPVISLGGLYLCLALMLAMLAFGLRRLGVSWRDGDIGAWSLTVGWAFLVLPIAIGIDWWPTTVTNTVLAVTAGAVVAWYALRLVTTTRDFQPSSIGDGFGTVAMMSLGLMAVIFVLLGIGKVLNNLPAMASNGLDPPAWISGYDWAKPSLMLMGFWAAVGSNNMLLYLAALTNVPDALYEAADIDGASRFQKFWNVTWPQLAPTTFFIVVMSMIAGIQGGFEMAKTMTDGGPAGSTTTLSYYIYNEGFTTGRLGYASAIAWVMFAMIFVITMINWKFGNRYVND